MHRRLLGARGAARRIWRCTASRTYLEVVGAAGDGEQTVAWRGACDRTSFSWTPERHVARLFDELGARDRAQLVVLAYENALVLPGQAV